MTQDEFLKVLPAYIGCKVLMPKGGEIGTMSEINSTGEVTCYDTVEAYTRVRSKEMYGKLILRPLSEMTFDEYMKWCSTIIENPSVEKVTEFYTEIIRLAKKGLDNFIVNASWSLIECTRFINYLRSIGIDCDGLIESGFAVAPSSGR